MDTKTEVGRMNVSFEMESKQEDHAETYTSLVFREDTPKAKSKVETQLYKDSDSVKHHPLFLIVSAIAVASLLTALATLVLAVAIMTARSEVSTGTATITSPCFINRPLSHKKFLLPNEKLIS